MKFIVVLFTLLAVQAAFAHDARPSQASLTQLSEVMHTSQILDNYVTQINTTMHASMCQAMQGRPLNAEQQQIMDD